MARSKKVAALEQQARDREALVEHAARNPVDSLGGWGYVMMLITENKAGEALANATVAKGPNKVGIQSVCAALASVARISNEMPAAMREAYATARAEEQRLITLANEAAKKRSAAESAMRNWTMAAIEALKDD